MSDDLGRKDEYLYFLVDTKSGLGAQEDVENALFEMGEDKDYEYEALVGQVLVSGNVRFSESLLGSVRLATARRKRTPPVRGVRPL